MQDFGPKVSLFLVFVVSSAALIALLELSNLLLCSNKIYLTSQVKNVPDAIIVNGKVIDYMKFNDTTIINMAKPFAGLDMSSSFPTFTILGRLPGQTTYLDPDIQICVGNRTAIADSWLQERLSETGYKVVNSQLVNCPLPNHASGECFFTSADKNELINAVVGDIVITNSEISQKTNIATSDVLVKIRGKVYNVGNYLYIASNLNNGQYSVNAETAFFANPITAELIASAGQDMTAQFNQLPGADEVLKCFDKLFYAGVSEADSLTIGCTLVQPVYFALLAILLLFLLPKHLLAFFFPLASGKEIVSDAYLITMIHCAGQNASKIQKTLDSVVSCSYRDAQKLLFIVCDGYIQPLKAGSTNVEILLNLLNYHGPAPTSRNYSSIGEGSRAANSCLIYHGHFIKDGHKIPYVLLSKQGTYGDEDDKGARGIRDSQLLLFGFLNKITSSSSYLSSVEYELYTKIRQLKFDPRRFEYVMMLEAGMALDTRAVSRLVNRMDSDEDVAILSADTETSSLFHGYHEYLKNHLTSLYESSLGAYSYTGENATLLRLKYADGTPCIIESNIVREYANNYDVPRNMKQRVLAYQAKQKHLGVCLLKHQPKLQMKYEPSACVQVDSPSFIRSLLYEKMDHNSRFMSLRDSVTLGWRYKIAGYISLLAMVLLPAFAIYNYVLIAKFATSSLIFSNIIPVAALVLLHLFCFIGLMLQMKFRIALSALLFLVLGIPYFYIVVPIYSFWCMNSYGVTPKYPELDEKSMHGSRGTGVPVQVESYTLSQWQTMNPSDLISEKTPLPETLSRDPSLLNSPLSLNTFAVQRKEPTLEREPVRSAMMNSAREKRMSSVLTEQRRETTGRSQFLDDTIRRSQIKDFKNSQIEAFMTRPESAMSTDTIRAPIQTLRVSAKNIQKPQLPQKPSFIRKPMSPIRAESVARSDYESILNGGDDRTSIGRFRDTKMTTFSHVQGQEDPGEQTGLTKSEIRGEIQLILQDADLNNVTRREVKNALIESLGRGVEQFDDFINVCIEEFTLEKLALL